MKHTILFSCDPGKASGVALFDITGIRDGYAPQKIWSGEWDEKDFYRKMHDLFESYRALSDQYDFEVVCENFIITVAGAKLKPGPWSLNYIGALDYYCTIYGIPFALQQPSQKDFATDAKIKALGFDKDQKKGAGHAYDAIRHAIIYMVMKYQWRPPEMLDANEET